MQPGNNSILEEFILVGIPVPRHLVIFIFYLLLLIFALTLLGNLLIILLVLVSSRLHSPMYFFLFNLSIMEIAYTLSIIPVMLFNLISTTKSISFYGCMMQCFFYFGLGAAEYLLLAVMSFDRYVAICRPLHYASIMNFKLCARLILFCWVVGFLFMLWPVIAISKLPFCGSVVNHFFCDIEPLLAVSFISAHNIELLAFMVTIVVILGYFIVTSASYMSLIITVLKIPSASGRQKAFSTYSAHITVASIFYGSAMFMYMRPSKSPSLNLKKSVSTLTALITPLLNPFIYTLRNEKVKEAVRDLLKRKIYGNTNI